MGEIRQWFRSKRDAERASETNRQPGRQREFYFEVAELLRRFVFAPWPNFSHALKL